MLVIMALKQCVSVREREGGREEQRKGERMIQIISQEVKILQRLADE